MTAAPVVIVGGGFGGLYTALALAARKGHPPILLIEPNERFLFLPLLYELFSGDLRSWEIAPRYDAKAWPGCKNGSAASIATPKPLKPNQAAN